MRLKPSEIKVGERFRKDIGDVSKLAQTIDKIGLLQPIGVNSNNELVFGERRLEAWKEVNGDEPIPIRRVDNPLAELIENVVRKNMTWQEEAKAIKKIHKELCEEPSLGNNNGQEHNPDGTFSNKEWSQENTARVLGVSQPTIAQNLKLADGLERYPDLEDEEFRSNALNRIDTRDKVGKIRGGERVGDYKPKSLPCELVEYVEDLRMAVKEEHDEQAECNSCEIQRACAELRRFIEEILV